MSHWLVCRCVSSKFRLSIVCCGNGTTYADSHSLRFASVCSAIRSDLVRTGGGDGGFLESSAAARSACASQSSSSHASGTMVFFTMAKNVVLVFRLRGMDRVRGSDAGTAIGSRR